ncbi:MAG: peptidoglycan DD-metalloendopeptidase family protein [Bacteriovoracaceae bacterium]|nr:peptidoglycan DD-metalloendopeptidase family protein [Bacteriovoracaceae bacterium]
MKLGLILLFISMLLPWAKAEHPLPAQIKKTEKEIKHLRSRMDELERNLHHRNGHYLQVIEQRREIEKKHQTIADQLQKDETSIEQELAQTNELFKKLVLAHLGQDIDAAQLLSQKIMQQKLRQQILTLQNNLDRLAQARAELDQIAQGLQTFAGREQALGQDLAQMEKLKQEVLANYMELMDQKNSLQEQLAKATQNERGKKYLAPASAKKLGLIPPVLEFSQVESGKKGVTFYYQGGQDVVATGPGKIAYVGSLATFGEVAMIDHGNDTRSVILGPFKGLVQKGDLVQKGQVIGRTKEKAAEAGKIYFEVRRHNQALYTARLLDKNLLRPSSGIL